MIIEIEGSKEVIENAVAILDELPNDYRPLFFTDTEGVLDKENDLCSNLKRFHDFRESNPLGFMLYSKCCEMDVSFSENENSSLFIEVKRKASYKQASNVLKLLAKSHPVFGYAGMWEERKYRNGTFKNFDGSTLEWWVGRDVDRYVPGLYWLTLLSREKLKLLKVAEEPLYNVASSIVLLEDDSYILAKLYDNAEDWEDNKDRIDKYCSTQDGIFSKLNIQEKLDQITNRAEYDAFMAEWP